MQTQTMAIDYKNVLWVLLGENLDIEILEVLNGTSIRVQDLLDAKIGELGEIEKPDWYEIWDWKPHIRHHNDVSIDYTWSTKARQQRSIHRIKADILRQTKKKTKIISDLHSLIIYQVKEVLWIPENIEKIWIIPPYYTWSQYSIHINKQLIDALQQEKQRNISQTSASL